MRTTRTTCRVCGGQINDLLSLGSLDLAAFPATQAEVAVVPTVPLDLTACADCDLVQLRHTVDPDRLFRQYWYRSAINETMRAELQDVVKAALLEVSVFPGDDVIDVGANDGYLLSCYPKMKADWRIQRIAYEPATNLQADCAKAAEQVIPDYFPTGVEAWERRVKILTSIAAGIYATEDPVAFVRAIDTCLHPDGVWVVQFQDLAQMVDQTAFDNICLPTGDRVLTPTGLRAIDTLVVGDQVLTHKGRYRPVREIFTHEHNGDLVELTAYGFGHTLRVTPTHPVLVRCADQWRYVPAEQLHIGDIVARPILTEEPAPTTIPCWVGRGRHPEQLQMLAVKDLLTLFGYYLAEGSIGSNGDVIFYFGPTEQTLAEDCQRRIHALGFGAQIDPRPTTLAVQAHGPLARVLVHECGRGAEGKHLSPLLLALTPEDSEELLRAYIAGDGYEYRTSYLRASTVSEQLALDMALLANRAGWKASINEQDRPATCVIEGRVVAQLPLWDILIHREPQLKQKVWLEDGYQCGRIREVHRVSYHGLVHNIEVEDDNTYVTPAMTVHNCHEHLTYWSLATFETLLQQAGVALQVVHAERRLINGGSLRLLVRRPTFPVRATVDALRLYERQSVSWSAIERFAWKAGEVRYQIQAAVEQATGHGLTIDLYGASTKANTLLQYCGLDGTLIRQAWERNREKVGRWTATGIPIVDEVSGRADPPQILLAGIWQFRAAVLQREATYLAQGGQILFPLPEVDLVTGRQVAAEPV